MHGPDVDALHRGASVLRDPANQVTTGVDVAVAAVVAVCVGVALGTGVNVGVLLGAVVAVLLDAGVGLTVGEDATTSMEPVMPSKPSRLYCSLCVKGRGTDEAPGAMGPIREPS